MTEPRDPDGRYLMIRMSVLPDDGGVKRARAEFTTVRGHEVSDYEANHWKVVIEDPFPHMYAPWARNDDCA